MKGRFVKVFIVLIVTIFCFFNIAISQPTIDEVLKDIKKKAKLINNYKVDYILGITKDNKLVKSRGHIEFLNPDNFYMEVQIADLDNAKQIFISDGNVLWQYMPDMKIATKLRLTNINEEMQENFEKKGDIRNPFANMKSETIKLVKEVVKDDSKIYIIEAEPKNEVRDESVVKISKAKIWINSENGIPEKVEWRNEIDETVIEQEFKNIKVNGTVDKDKFTFIPPADVKVMDLNKQEID